MGSAATVFPINMVRICIDGYKEDLFGRAYSKLMPVPLLFSGCSGILLSMDDLFDQAGYPQAFQVKRTFFRSSGPKKNIHMPERTIGDEEINRQRGDCRTFDIVVQSRRQSCWQGILMDPGRTSMKRFRSEMELLEFICREMELFPGCAEKKGNG